MWVWGQERRRVNKVNYKVKCILLKYTMSFFVKHTPEWKFKKKPADISLVMCGRVCCSPDKQSLDSVPPLRNVPSHPKGLSASV